MLQRLKKKLFALLPPFANRPANSDHAERAAETAVPDMRRNMRGLDNVVLHIGQPKTGTTLLQNWALANGAALASEGIFVLPSELDAHRLAVNCVTESSRLQMPDIPPIQTLPFDSACRTLLEGASRTGVHTALVSSEYFSIVDPSDAATMFAGMGTSVTRVICFVRRANAAGLPEIAHLAIKAQASGLTGTRFAFSERERRSILQLYRSSNSRLAKEDPSGEFGNFAHARDNNPGLNMTGTFPAEFALKLLAWQINQTPNLPCRSDDSNCHAIENASPRNASSLTRFA